MEDKLSLGAKLIEKGVMKMEYLRALLRARNTRNKKKFKTGNENKFW